MNNFKFMVGDIVQVVDIGACYTTYCDFFRENDISIDIAARYRYDFPLSEIIRENPDVLFKVMAVGTHGIDGTKIYAITALGDWVEHCYLIGERGITEETTPMTLEEIEEILGYKIRIV